MPMNCQAGNGNIEKYISLTLVYFCTAWHGDSVQKIIRDPVCRNMSNRWVQQAICESIERDVAVWPRSIQSFTRLRRSCRDDKPIESDI